MKKKEDTNDVKYQVYLDERKALNDAAKETQHQFDKAILTLSAGALALSLTFIRDVIKEPQIGTFWLLFSSWTTFVLSILSTLISFFTSQKACTRQIEIMESEFIADNQETGESKEKNLYNTYTHRLNVTSITFFILGVILLILFCSINLGSHKEEPMGDKKDITTPLKKVEEGYEPPKKPIPKPAPVKKAK